jgi:hypothetical protein
VSLPVNYLGFSEGGVHAEWDDAAFAEVLAEIELQQASSDEG